MGFAMRMSSPGSVCLEIFDESAAEQFSLDGSGHALLSGGFDGSPGRRLAVYPCKERNVSAGLSSDEGSGPVGKYPVSHF